MLLLDAHLTGFEVLGIGREDNFSSHHADPCILAAIKEEQSGLRHEAGTDRLGDVPFVVDPLGDEAQVPAPVMGIE